MTMNNTDKRIAARDAGERFYFTGVPCKRGHVSQRYASTGGCMECVKGGGRSKAVTCIQRPYVLRSVVALNITEAELLSLDTYLHECILKFSDSIGKPMPFEPYRIQWARANGRSVHECPMP